MKKKGALLTVCLCYAASLFSQNNLIGLQIGEAELTRNEFKKPVFFSQLTFGYEGKLNNHNMYWNGNLGIGRTSFDYSDTLQNSKFERVIHATFPLGIRKYSLARIGNAKGGAFWGIGLAPNILMIRTIETRRDVLVDKHTDYFTGFNFSFYGEIGYRFFLTNKWAMDVAIIIQQDLLPSDRRYATDVSKIGLLVSFSRRTKDNVWEKN